jgi:uncharacterized protein (DUF952 family)
VSRSSAPADATRTSASSVSTEVDYDSFLTGSFRATPIDQQNVTAAPKSICCTPVPWVAVSRRARHQSARDILKMTLPAKANAHVFKICSTTEWSTATTVLAFHGSADDLRDGYIHLSTAEQALETARKYFSNRDDLLLVAFEVAQLGPLLRWESSRGGALFPHLYAALPTALAVGVVRLTLTPDGVPDIAAALSKLQH